MTNLQRAMRIYGSQAAVAEAIEQETGHKLAHTTIGRALSGEGKPATMALIDYALNNIFERSPAVTDAAKERSHASK